MWPVPENSPATAPSPSMRLASGMRSRARCPDREREWQMAKSPLAGHPVPRELLFDVARLEREYYERKPDPADPNQRVAFGTSGHRGTALCGTFTEAHILAITQAICEYRRVHGIDGPVF